MLIRNTTTVLILLLGTMPILASTDVTVIYSHRVVPHGPAPEPEIIANGLEGAIEATFTGAGPIDLAEPLPGFVRVNAATFTYHFRWDDTAPLAVAFVDGVGDTTVVVAEAVSPMLLDPALHALPIVHVQTAPAGLWDPATGIYVWGDFDNIYQHGDAWEHPATVDYYDGTLEPVFSTDVGLRLHGGYSRCYDQKGMRFYFDHGPPPAAIAYDFFGSEPADFRRLIIKTHRYPDLSIISDAAEALFREQGHLAARNRHVVAYLNGEYWGTYSLKERIDEEFVEFTHDLGDPDYILIKDCAGEHGDAGVWVSFLASFDDVADPESHAWYTWVEENLDLASYINWMFINIFGATTDNVYCGNLVLLKPGDQPWRYVMWDEDGLFLADNLNSDHFRWFTSLTEAEYDARRPPVQHSGSWAGCQPYFEMFHRLMQNSEFKARFSARAGELLAGDMSVAALQARLDANAAAYAGEKNRQGGRWNWPGGYYDWILAVTRAFIADRHPVVVAQLAAFMDEFRVPVELSHFAAEACEPGACLTWRTESEQDNAGFLVYRQDGANGSVDLLASYTDTGELVGAGTSGTPTVYQFQDTTAPSLVSLSYQLAHVSSQGDTTLVDWIEPVYIHDLGGLVFNEVMADNDATVLDEYGESDDWIELHNNAAGRISLDGCFISDDPNVPTKHRFTGGLVIGPGRKLVLWADDQTLQGSRHLGFRLSDDGETVALFAPDGMTLLDQVGFDQQLEDHSYQRFPDGVGDWTYAWNPTPAAPNAAPRIHDFLLLNEVMAQNAATIADEAGDFDPWLEIYNRLPVPVALDRLAISAAGGLPSAWTLPDGDLAGRTHLIVWLDDEPLEGPLHATVSVDVGGGVLGLHAPDDANIDIVAYPALAVDEVLARVPDGGNWSVTDQATPGAPNPVSLQPLLVLNEFLASNDTGIQDETGAYEDWIEIHNPTLAPVQLGGMYLSDDLDDSTRWPLPSMILEPGGFVVIWCDDDPTDGPLHATFKLAAGGEAIGLWTSLSDGNQLLDSIEFGAQVADVSLGRQTDAGWPWIAFGTPTPGSSNGVGVAVPESLPELRLDAPYPNPFNPAVNLSFRLPSAGRTDVAVFDVRGRRVCHLFSGDLPAGAHGMVWRGRDDSDQPVASGTYLARLIHADQTRTRRLMLVR